MGVRHQVGCHAFLIVATGMLGGEIQGKVLRCHGSIIGIGIRVDKYSGKLVDYSGLPGAQAGSLLLGQVIVVLVSHEAS